MRCQTQIYTAYNKNKNMAKNDKIFNNNFDSPDFELNGTIKFIKKPHFPFVNRIII